MRSSSPTIFPTIPSFLTSDEQSPLQKTDLLDDTPVEALRRLTRWAVDGVEGSGGYVGLLVGGEQHLRGTTGLPEPMASARAIPQSHALGTRVVDREQPLVVEDVAADPEMEAPFARGALGIRGYLGVPLTIETGASVGVLCVVDGGARDWSGADVGHVQDVAASVETEINHRLERTRRTEMETQLRARTEAFETLMENITGVVTVLDAQGRIRSENSSVEEVLGYAPHELEGTSIWDYVHPADRSTLEAKLQAALDGTERSPTVEVRFRHADGSWRTLELRGRRLPEEVDLGSLIGVSRDITQTRRLRERVRLLATAVDEAGTGVLITGPNLEEPGPEILYVNEAMTEMTGYDEEELLGNTPRMLQGPETDRAELNRLKQRLSEGKSVVDETVNYRKDGTPYYLRWRINPIRNEDGEITHFVSVQENLTDEKEREQELERRVEARTRELRAARDEAERASHLKSAFLANMSHEIRTPLTSIIGFTETIAEELDQSDRDLETVSRFADLIQQSGHRLLGTLSAVLNLSKLEAGEMELSFGPVDLADEAASVATLFRPQAAEAAVDLRTDVPDAPVRAWADPEGVRIVLRNLLSNAIKFTEEGGRVSVRVQSDGKQAVLAVEDTGIGMDPDQVPQLLEAFHQASTGTGRSHEGSGIGLSVTKRFVDQMGGSIDVATEPDAGTRITVSLPTTGPTAPGGEA